MSANQNTKKFKPIKQLMTIPLLIGLLLLPSKVISQETIYVETRGVALAKLFKVKISNYGYEMENIIPMEDLSKDEMKEMDIWKKNLPPNITDFKIYRMGNGGKKLVPSFKSGTQFGVSTRKDKLEGKYPLFPNCKGTDEEMARCFKENLLNHIGENFNTGIIDKFGFEPGLKRENIIFQISNIGKVIDVEVDSGNMKLKEEVERVLESLPTLESCEQLGPEIQVKYSVPFNILVY